MHTDSEKKISNDHNQRTYDRGFRLVLFLLFLISFLLLMAFLHTHLSRLINSDDSSELILSKLLAEKNQILSTDWFYSTELRVFNTQLIYSFFFRLFDGWHRVRWLSMLSMCSVMLAACYFMFRQLNLRRFFCGCSNSSASILK